MQMEGHYVGLRKAVSHSERLRAAYRVPSSVTTTTSTSPVAGSRSDNVVKSPSHQRNAREVALWEVCLFPIAPAECRAQKASETGVIFNAYEDRYYPPGEKLMLFTAALYSAQGRRLTIERGVRSRSRAR